MPPLLVLYRASSSSSSSFSPFSPPFLSIAACQSAKRGLSPLLFSSSPSSEFCYSAFSRVTAPLRCGDEEFTKINRSQLVTLEKQHFFGKSQSHDADERHKVSGPHLLRQRNGRGESENEMRVGISRTDHLRTKRRETVILVWDSKEKPFRAWCARREKGKEKNRAVFV